MKHLKNLLFGVLLVAGLATLANLLIDNPYTQKAVALAINSKTRELTHLHVKFQAIKVSLLPLGVDLFGLDITPEDDLTHSLVTASQMRARLSIWGLVLGRFRLARIEARDLQVSWPWPAGLSALLKVDESPSNSSPVLWPLPNDIPVDRLVLQSARFAIDHTIYRPIPFAPTVLSSSLAGVDLDVKTGDFRNIRSKLRIASANIAMADQSIIEDGEIELESAITQNAIHSTYYRVKSERSDLSGSITGLIAVTGDTPSLLSAIDLEVGAEGKADLSVLGSLLDIGDTRGPVRGKVTGRVFIPVESKQAASLDLNGEGTVNDGYISGFRLFNSKAGFKVSTEEIVFNQVDAIIGEEKVGAAKGFIKFNDAIDFNFQIKPETLRLTQILDVFDVDFEGVDFSMKSPLVTLKGKGFPFGLTADGAIDLEHLNVALLNASKPDPKRLPTCPITARLSASIQSFNIDSLKGDCALLGSDSSRTKSALEIDGKFFFNEAKGMSLQIRSPSFAAELINGMEPIPVGGAGPLLIKVHGPYNKVQADVQTTISGLSAMNMNWGNSTVVGTAYADRFEWSEFSAKLPGRGTVKSPHGLVRFDSRFPFEANLEAIDVSPAVIQNHARGLFPGSTVSFGINSANLKVKGFAEQPLTWLVEGRGSILNLSWDNQMLAETLSAHFHNNGSDSTIDEVALRLGTLQITGSVGVQRKGVPVYIPAAQDLTLWQQLGGRDSDEVDLKLTAAPSAETPTSALGKQLDHLSTLPWIGTALESATIRGQIEAKLALKGPVRHLTGTAQGSVSPLEIAGSGMAPLQFRAFIAGEKVDVVANHSGTALEARISLLLLQPGVPFEWYIRMNRLDLRAFLSQYFTRDPRNYAYLSGSWELKGKLTDFWNSRGAIDLTDLRLQYGREAGGALRSLVMRNRQPARIAIRDGFWQFADGGSWAIGSEAFDLNIGLIGNHLPNDLHIAVTSSINMALLKDFIDPLESGAGKLAITGLVTGPIDHPKLRCEIVPIFPSTSQPGLEPLSIGISELRPAFKNIRGKVIYNDGKFILDDILADKGNGTVRVNGSLDMGSVNAEESHVEVALRDAAVALPVSVFVFDTSLTGDLVLSGSERPYRLSGQLVINRARSSKDFDIRQEILNSALRGRSGGAGGSGGPTQDPFMEIDVNVSGKNSISISNRNIQGSLSATLQVTGNDTNPTVTGQVEVVRGKFFYRRDFNIKRGLFTFDDPLRPDPYIDVLAASEVGNYKVFITMSGRASDPKVDLSVDPPIREDGTPISKVDILLLLSSGSFPQVSRSNQGGGFSTEDASRSAGTEALNIFVGQFEEPVEKLFDLSGQRIVRQVYIDTYLSQASDKPMPRFNVPLNLSRDLDVMLRYDAEGTWRVSSELPLHDSISLFGSVEQQKDELRKQSKAPADTGVDLRFRFSFP